MALPLDGIQVLDLSRVLAGPWCTQLLADLGADVIKIERPGSGDDTRHWGPPWLKDENGADTQESSYYLATNRGKRSVAVNIATVAGQDIVKTLAEQSDVLVENFKVGALAKKGLGFEALSALNPGLIYLSITGFGQTGPMASQPGYDYLAQALGGFMSVTGPADGEPGAGPNRGGVAIADLSTGMYATVAVLGALIHKANTGQGQHIDLALLDTQVTMLANQALSYLISGVTPTRTGVWHPSLAPYQVFQAADEPFVLAVGNDSQFASLCSFIGREELILDARFATNPDRNAHRQVLADFLQATFGLKNRSHWIGALPSVGVPCASVNSIDEVFAEPQVKARGMQISLPTAAGPAPGVANPINFSATPVQYSSGPPQLGEHTDEVLSEKLGLSTEALTQLRADGVL